MKSSSQMFIIDESGARIGCGKGEEVIVTTECKQLYAASPENKILITIVVL
jgi:hypothetical protein